MKELVGLLAFGLALTLAVLTGAYAGRSGERRRVAEGRSSLRGITPVANYEAAIRRSVGAPRMHPDPENAPRQRRLRYHR